MTRRNQASRVFEEHSQPQHAADTRVAPQFRDIVAIGASAGAIEALTALVATLPADFSGSLFVVLHMDPDPGSKVPQILARAGALPVVAPKDMTRIAKGRIYVSSPNRHLLLERDRVRVVRGPKENRHRPAIDPLFRSAAWAYGPRVVGVILTGMGDDGAAGLWAIKSCGGTTVVQDPASAAHPQMPESALLHNEIDHCIPLDQIAPLLTRLAREPINGHDYASCRPTLKTEVEFDTMGRDITDMGSLGKLSPFTCPACRGALWELQDGDILRYRCHTGHAFSEESLRVEQSIAIEEGLYSALRAVEEKATLLRRLSKGWREKYPHIVSDYMARARALDQSADLLRKLICRGST